MICYVREARGRWIRVIPRNGETRSPEDSARLLQNNQLLHHLARLKSILGSNTNTLNMPATGETLRIPKHLVH